MAQTSYLHDGTATGDAAQAPYNAAEWALWWSSIHVMDRTKQGVLPTLNPTYDENLATRVVVTDVEVDPGIAMVDGTLYFNSAAIALTLAAVGAGTNYYTVVLRKDYAAQTVRAILLGPVNGGPRPAVTQTALVWEIEIAEVQQTNADVVTVTDLRAFIDRPEVSYLWIPAIGGYSTTLAAVLTPYLGYILLDVMENAYARGNSCAPKDMVRDSHPWIYAIGAAQDGGVGNTECELIVSYGNAAEVDEHYETITQVRDATNPLASPAFKTLAYMQLVDGMSPGDVIITSLRRLTGGADTFNKMIFMYGWILAYQAI